MLQLSSHLRKRALQMEEAMVVVDTMNVNSCGMERWMASSARFVIGQEQGPGHVMQLYGIRASAFQIAHLTLVSIGFAEEA